MRRTPKKFSLRKNRERFDLQKRETTNLCGKFRARTRGRCRWTGALRKGFKINNKEIEQHNKLSSITDFMRRICPLLEGIKGATIVRNESVSTLKDKQSNQRNKVEQSLGLFTKSIKCQLHHWFTSIPITKNFHVL